MQELSLKYENQKTSSDSLETIRVTLQAQVDQMQGDHSKLVAENEKLRRERLTKERLIESQEKAHKEYVRSLREEYLSLEQAQAGIINQHIMEFEDIRTLTNNHYVRICQLEAIEADLREKLDFQTREKEHYISLYNSSTTECENLRKTLIKTQDELKIMTSNFEEKSE